MKPLIQILLITVSLNFCVALLVAQEVNPSPPPGSSLQKGLEYFKSKNYQEAVLEFRQATQVEPENAFAYYLLGLSLANLKQYKDAIEPLRKSLSLNPHPHWGTANEKMVRELLAEVKHNAGIKTAAKCPDLEFDPKSDVPGFGDDGESQRATAILTELLHSEAAARAVVGRAKVYADDSPYNYSAILKIAERLAIKDFCGAEVLSTIKSCGDVVAAIDGDDADLAEVALSLADLRTTETEGHAVLSALNYKGIPVFNLLGKMTGKSPDYIKRAALNNQLDLKVTFSLLLGAFDGSYGGLAHKVAEQRQRTKRP